MDSESVKRRVSASGTISRRGKHARAPADPALPERLRQAMGHRAIFSVARAAGISDTGLRAYLRGTNPGVDKLAKLAEVLGVSLEWLATGKGGGPRRSPAETVLAARDLALVPVYPVHLGAGMPRVVQPAGIEPEGHYPLPLAAARRLAPQPSALVALRVEGPSMEPRIPHGWIAIIDTTRTMIRPKGGIYAVRLDDGLMIKHAQWEGDSLVLSSDNPEHPPMRIDPPDAERVQVLGFVVAWFQPHPAGGTQD